MAAGDGVRALDVVEDLADEVWMFSQSVRGVTASANLYSLIETAKGHELDPHDYLLQLFEQLPKAESIADFEALLPDTFKNGQ